MHCCLSASGRTCVELCAWTFLRSYIPWGICARGGVRVYRLHHIVPYTFSRGLLCRVSRDWLATRAQGARHDRPSVLHTAFRRCVAQVRSKIHCAHFVIRMVAEPSADGSGIIASHPPRHSNQSHVDGRRSSRCLCKQSGLLRGRLCKRPACDGTRPRDWYVRRRGLRPD
jgi:hypothetical protein